MKEKCERNKRKCGVIEKEWIFDSERNNAYEKRLSRDRFLRARSRCQGGDSRGEKWSTKMLRTVIKQEVAAAWSGDRDRCRDRLLESWVTACPAARIARARYVDKYFINIARYIIDNASVYRFPMFVKDGSTLLFSELVKILKVIYIYTYQHQIHLNIRPNIFEIKRMMCNFFANYMFYNFHKILQIIEIFFNFFN